MTRKLLRLKAVMLLYRNFFDVRHFIDKTYILHVGVIQKRQEMIAHENHTRAVETF